MQYHEAQVVHLFAVLTWGRPPVDFIRKKKKSMHAYIRIIQKQENKKKRKKKGGTGNIQERKIEEETRRIKPTWKFQPTFFF